MERREATLAQVQGAAWAFDNITTDEPAALETLQRLCSPEATHGGVTESRRRRRRQLWAAFRELCGRTPASVRLGKLVVAEVGRNARESSATPDALAALRAIQDQASVLESCVRASKSAGG
jgi:hypothetical protein